MFLLRCDHLSVTIHIYISMVFRVSISVYMEVRKKNEKLFLSKGKKTKSVQKEQYQLLTGQKSSVIKFVESSFTIEHSLCLLSELSMCINTKWCFFDYRPVDSIVLIHRVRFGRL